MAREGFLSHRLHSTRRPAHGLLRWGRALAANVLQAFLDAAAAQPDLVPIGGVFKIDEIQHARRGKENGGAAGKLAVTT